MGQAGATMRLAAVVGVLSLLSATTAFVCPGNLPLSRARTGGRRVVAAPRPSSISDFLDDPVAPDLDVKDPIAPALDDNQQYFVRCGRCNAAYSITPDVIKPEGSRVKCEVCGHTWYQASNRLQVLGEGYVLKEYPDDMKEKVLDNVKNGRHPLDTSAQKGAISCFIGNLPFSLDEAAIKGIFEVYGPVVSVTIVKDNLNRSKGFGFVEMAVKENGEAAIAALDGKDIDGRNINVRLGTSKPQPKLRKERTQLAREGGAGDDKMEDSIGSFLDN